MKIIKQVFASRVSNGYWTRKIWIAGKSWQARLLGKKWAGGRRWSEEGEDALLLELAQEILPGGFYVDVGANLPTKRSNTYRLYCHGMRGLCVEPNLELAVEFERVRDGDSVVCAAVGDEQGVASLKRFNYHVYSTCSEQEAARRIEATSARMRTKLLGESVVPVVPLRVMLEHAAGKFSDPFFLLTTDTEGWDLEVLRSNDWERFRPRYVLTESACEGEEVRGFLGEQGYELYREFRVNQLYRDARVL